MPGRREGRLVDSNIVLHLYDTATRSVRELALREPGKVSIYLCGPTVYGPPHLGHGRATLVYDIMRRYLEWTGLDVRLVSNITDIEDKIIERALREDRPWQDITTKCEAIWWQAMDAVNFERPTDTPHATEYVDEMVDMIATLIASDHAYVTDDGVYMSVESVDDYGLLAHQSVDDMRSGGGDREVVGAAGKRHPADFVLWKFATGPATDSDPAWPSPWGAGRPGLALRVRRDEPRPAGRGLRSALRWPGPAVPAPRERTRPGGRARQDLREPLDAQRLRRRRRGREDVEEPRQRVEPARPHRALRPAGLPNGAAAVALPQPGQDHPGRHRRRREVARRTRRVRRPGRRCRCRPSPTPPCSTSSEAAMDDDLDTPRATALLFDTVRRANAALDAGDDTRRAARRRGPGDRRCRGTRASARPRRSTPTRSPAPRRSTTARAAKDFATADALRDELQADGWTVETTRDGTSLRR